MKPGRNARGEPEKKWAKPNQWGKAGERGNGFEDEKYQNAENTEQKIGEISRGDGGKSALKIGEVESCEKV